RARPASVTTQSARRALIRSIHHAESQTPPFPRAPRQAPRSRRPDPAGSVALPELRRGLPPAPGLPPLRPLQGTRGRRGDGGLRTSAFLPPPCRMGEPTERPIAIDAMGGDHAPAHPVAGAILAARELKVPIVLVGRKPEIEAELRRHHPAGLPITIRHADEVVGMEESPVNAFRRKKDSSIHVGATMLKDGEVQAFLSAGNTGAVMTTVKVLCGVLEGVERPALCAVVPNLHGPSVWLDVGANVDCRPVHLVQFAVMGHLYAREVLAIASPRVGLMSVGEEAGKGNDVTREAFRSL